MAGYSQRDIALFDVDVVNSSARIITVPAKDAKAPKRGSNYIEAYPRRVCTEPSDGERPFRHAQDDAAGS